VKTVQRLDFNEDVQPILALWPCFRLEIGTGVLLGQTGDYQWNQPFSAGGWLMLRNAPDFALSLKVDRKVSALISKMDTTQHYRG
jgi:hypothetical protein